MCNPSGIGGDGCENSMRFQLEDVNFIEYEEFHPDKQPSNSVRQDTCDASEEKVEFVGTSDLDLIQETQNQENILAQQGEVYATTDRSEKDLPSQRQNPVKILFELQETDVIRNSVQSVADSKSTGSKKGKRDHGEMPLQEPQSRYDSVNTSVYLQENLKGIFYLMKGICDSNEL